MEIIKIMREKLMDRETQTTSFQMLVRWLMVVMVEGGDGWRSSLSMLLEKEKRR